MKRLLISGVAGIALLLAVTACDAKEVSKASIKQYFPEQYDKAVAVATCESGLDPHAISPGGGNWGLFQINTVHAGLVTSLGYEWNDILNPLVNARVARIIYNSSGWSAWSCG